MAATAQQTAAPGRGGGLVKIDGARGRFTRIPNELIEDPTLDPYELRVWQVIRLHDWQGAGWVFTYEELQAAVRCKADKLRRSLRVLRDRGLVRWEGVRPRPKRYFALLPTPPLAPPDGPAEAPPNDAGAPPPESDLIASEKRLNDGQKAIERRPESDWIASEKRLAPEVPYLDQRLSKTIKASALADASRARACETEPTPTMEEPLPAQLCAVLQIAPTPVALQGMKCLVRAVGTRCPRPLLEIAVEAAGWLEVRSGRGPASVAFFRNWIEREVRGSGGRGQQGREQDRGEHRGHSRADAAAAECATQRRDHYTDQRLKRWLAKGYTEASFNGV